jgi:dipeptidyl aminopeptidase/acylaminoacyl peptidase
MTHGAALSLIIALLLSSVSSWLPISHPLQARTDDARAINLDCPLITIKPPPPTRFAPLQASGHIAYANQGLHLLALKDGITLTLHSTAALVGRGMDGKLAWSPNARWIAFHYEESAYHCDQGYLMLADLAAGRVYRLTHTARELSAPTWSPDSRWVAVTDRQGVLTVYDRLGRWWVLSRRVKPLSPTTWLDNAHVLVLSPSKTSTDEERADVVALPLWGGGGASRPRTLLPNIRFTEIDNFTLSPNRKWLLYGSDPLNLLNVANGEQRVVPRAPVQPREPDRVQWSPDSHSILMHLGEGGLALAQVVTTPVTINLDVYGVPGPRQAWSPDSRSVSLITPSGIVVYNLSTRTAITYPMSGDVPSNLAWSPK